MGTKSSLATVSDPAPTDGARPRRDRPRRDRPRWNRLAASVRARDPSLRVSKRAVRAAVVVPSVFAIAQAISADANLQLFAAFGGFALMLFVDFPGRPRTQLRALGTLFVVGAVFIVVGTLCSEHPVAAVVVTAVVGFAVLFGGILSPLVTAGTMAALLIFVLPVAVAAPPGEIPDRLAGWALAGAVAIPAILLVWRRPFSDQLRHKLSGTARTLATLVAAHAEGRRDPAGVAAAETELAELRAQFESTSYPPTGAGPGDSALAKLVCRMEWVGTNAVLGQQQASVLDLPDVRDVNRAAADVLTASAALICDGRGRPVDDPAAVQAVAAAVDDLGAQRLRSQQASMDRVLDGTAAERAATALAAGRITGALAADDRLGPGRAPVPGDPAPGDEDPTAARLAGTRGARQDRLLGALDPTFRTRALSFAAEMVAEAAVESAGLSRPADADGRRRERVAWGSSRRTAAAHVDLRSVWFRNSLRGAIGLALAVAVVEMTDVNHGFWVVLGTLSVLRSNATGTGATALRALAGTVVGFVIGSAVMVGVGDHYGLLWALLPVAVLVSGIAPTTISFPAGQAAFTVLVVVLFNIIEPTGWKVGLTRIEDVAIGCGVSVVVGLLFWPRGAAAALGRALGEAYVAGSAYLLRAVERITSADDGLETEVARRASEAAYARMEDAYRQYVSERGAKPVTPSTATVLAVGAVRTRLAAYSLATLPRRAIDPGGPELPAVVAAGDSLWRSCSDAHRWYLSAGDVLAGRDDAVPPLRQHEGELHRLLVRAFLDSSGRRRTGDVGAVLRMLWADESLEDELALQHELADAVAQFARQRHVRQRQRGRQS